MYESMDCDGSSELSWRVWKACWADWLEAGGSSCCCCCWGSGVEAGMVGYGFCWLWQVIIGV